MGRLPFTHRDLMPFVELVLADSRDTERLARLSYAILASGSARKSDWAQFYGQGAGKEANYKAIERSMERLDPEAFLYRIIDGQSRFVLVDLTAVPIYLGLYSQATLEEEGTGRNLVWRAFLQEALRYVEPETVLVFDREFSFAGWLGVMAAFPLGKHRKEAGVQYAIRLNARFVREVCNRKRPHSALGYLTPEAFAEATLKGGGGPD